MKFSFQLQNVDNFEATATITMRISEWKELYEQMDRANLTQKWPSHHLANAAFEVFNSALQKFEKEIVVK